MDSNISEVEKQLRRLFKRCLQCPPMKLDCPACKDGEVCVQQADDCDVCASVSCVPVGQSGATESGQLGNKSEGPNVGAIAGGVAGGVVALAFITFLVWWFMIRKKKDEFIEYEEDEFPPEKDQFTLQRDGRASTHTVASLASTVLTRASNVIQIAYIPGVTNRSGPGSPGLLVPPVPPIPIPTSGSTTPNASEDLHFLPGDIRDTMYSDMSDVRSSYAQSSMTRNSVATERYRSSAVLSSTPATTVMRGRPAIVSVKSSQANTPVLSADLTPPVPALGDVRRFESTASSPQPAASARPVIKMPTSSDLSRSGSLSKGASYGKPTTLTIVNLQIDRRRRHHSITLLRW
ncbi:hypothetical protein P152DRAFT_35660 [Eremomyces bilateralis CBS 781.70]|uniref:Membrane anchor Opy2 N-terminal domain-containing protein n=1 Tax=Eremomyces bilateralis CBS 781.70 TaxID=1392243 RepID=A0A6G1G1H4_9PEZI|nr:uncharacterized protein P152DRAFT_35660 [Eremomyces bilateralis CBS 781.70]KAF1811868.1 hypothetical protein P152DRAFT_35660 [Eremomyces bilateralis CBS 781.70]